MESGVLACVKGAFAGHFSHAFVRIVENIIYDHVIGAGAPATIVDLDEHRGSAPQHHVRAAKRRRD